jgi:rubrerythrin
MGVDFNADEILGMAEQIERNGARFYEKAAEVVVDTGVRKLFLDLVVWERGHEKIFAAMRADLTEREREQTVFDPDREISLYLRAMADGHVFDVRREPAALLSGKETVEEILRLAIGLEKDSIIFYLGLKEFTQGKAGNEKIDGIVKEEMKHIAFLSRLIGTRAQERS